MVTEEHRKHQVSLTLYGAHAREGGRVAAERRGERRSLAGEILPNYHACEPQATTSRLQTAGRAGGRRRSVESRCNCLARLIGRSATPAPRGEVAKLNAENEAMRKKKKACERMILSEMFSVTLI